MTFTNSYEDDAYASAYAQIEFPGTYFLAFRDLPEMLERHVGTGKALDFGTGAGRSARFLKRLGFEVTGVDISAAMIERARAADPGGRYMLVEDGDLGALGGERFDLVLAAFPFDNIPTFEKKSRLFRGLRGLLTARGRIVNLVSSPEIYWNEWVSFSTRDFPENRGRKSGEEVLIVNAALRDTRPCVDILWAEEDYRAVYRDAGLEVLEVARPLGRGDEPYRWVSEETIAPWVLYVLGKA